MFTVFLVCDGGSYVHNRALWPTHNKKSIKDERERNIYAAVWGYTPAFNAVVVLLLNKLAWSWISFEKQKRAEWHHGLFIRAHRQTEVSNLLIRELLDK